TNYSVASTDMAGALNLGGSTATLTLPTASSSIFAPGMTLTFQNNATGNWTLTNSTGLTLSGLNSTTLYPGTSGTFVANNDGTHLDFFANCQVATTSVMGCVKPDGSTITISGNTISAVGGGGGSATIVAPQGRLYLTTHTPVPTTDVTGASQ